MREGWRETTLGEVFEPSNVRLGLHDSEPTVFSISKYDGVMPSNEFFGKRVASARLDGYKLLGDDAWVYSTIHIDEGSIARNTTGNDGVVSPMYTVMRWVSELDDPRYAELLLRSAEMLAVYADSSQGSINRRRSLPWKAFSSISVAMPPLDEQRRIVDLIAAVDDAVEAAEVEAVAARKALTDVLVSHAEFGGDSSLDEMFVFSLGGAWGAEPGDEAQPVRALGPSAFRGGAVTVDPELATARSLSTSRAAARALQRGDVVLERSGGGPTQPVGRVIRMETFDRWVVPSDFMRLLRVDPAVTDPGFAFWVLWASYQAGLAIAYQKRTTSIYNLNIPDYLAGVKIAMPDIQEQRRIARFGDEGWSAVAAARETASALRTLRTNLLTVLLSGEHEIPASYDALVEGATV